MLTKRPLLGAIVLILVVSVTGGRPQSPTTTTTTTSPCPLPATGQTTCWNSNGTVISCAGTGQDGDLRKGAPLAYVDNGNGTIMDNNTGLMWEKQSMDGSVHDVGKLYTWDQAFSVHVATLNSTNFAGHNDWRVPNYKELVSILNLQNVQPAVSPAFNNNCSPGCTVTGSGCPGACSCTASSEYWSSTSSADDPSVAWDVLFDFGTVDFDSKIGANSVRGVRGGP